MNYTPRQPNPDDDAQWRNIVLGLGGTEDQAGAEAAREQAVTNTPRQLGPRDYEAPEDSEDFIPPEPRAIASSNPRMVLSWLAIAGIPTILVLLGVMGVHITQWILFPAVIGIFAGLVSLFFLLPSSKTPRDLPDDDDFGNGAKI